MEDLTLALITLTSFVLLFVVAIFADRMGETSDSLETSSEKVRVSVEGTDQSVADEFDFITSSEEGVA